jgi:hypothetical protein
MIDCRFKRGRAAVIAQLIAPTRAALSGSLFLLTREANAAAAGKSVPFHAT